MHSKLKILLVGIILLTGFGLRYRYYDQVPVIGDSLDEYSFTWVGLSLIRIGVPVGAIGVGGYENTIYRYINVDRIFQTGIYASPVKINYPWFDHPPLLGLVTGGYAYLSGARVFEDTALFIIRKPMVLLGVAAVALTMLLTYEFWGFWPAAAAGIIYATSPLVVVSSRMVQAENLLLIWFLAILWLVKKRYWGWVGIFTGLAVWTKFSAAAIFPVILWQIYQLENKKEKLAAVVKWGKGLLPMLMMLGIYYGIQGGGTFLAVSKANSSRDYAIGPTAVYELITKQRITHLKFLTDGWIIAAWAAFLAVSYGSKKNSLMQVFLVSYLGVYILFGNFPHGWYALPLWPILFICLGNFVFEAIKNHSWQLVLLSLVPLGIGINRLWPYPQFNALAGAWRWGIPGLLLLLMFKQNKMTKFLALGLFLAAIIINAVWVAQLDATGWYKIY